MKKMMLVLFVVLLFGGMAAAGGDEGEGVTVTQPFLITSIGQSPDSQMVRVLCNRLELEFGYDEQVDVEGLEGYEAIFLVVGGSSKGLGAAGIDAAKEIERTNALLEGALEKNMVLVGVHVGGPARRGSLSNQFVEVVFPKAHLMVVVESGNEDGYFTAVAEETGVMLYLIEQVVNMTEILQEIVE